MNSVNDRSVRVSSLTAHFTNDDVTTGDDISYTSSSSSSFDSMKPSNIHVFSASSTLHGFSHIFALHHSTLRRFTWTVAFLTSLTILLYQSSNRVIYYLSYPHVTRLDEVTAGNLTFPAATICNLNEFRFYQITKNDMYHVGQLLGFLDINGSLIKPSFYTDIENMDEHIRPRMREIKRRIDEVTYFRNFSPRGTFDMMEFYERVGHNLSDFLLACNYRGRPCSVANFSTGPLLFSPPSVLISRVYHDHVTKDLRKALREICPSLIIHPRLKLMIQTAANYETPTADAIIFAEITFSGKIPSFAKFVTSKSAPHSMLSYTMPYQYPEQVVRNVPVRSYGKTVALPPNAVFEGTKKTQENTHEEHENVESALENTEKEEEKRQPKPSDFVFFASNSTFHGISHIFSEGKFSVRKALWALAFFSSLGFFLFQAYDRYGYYRSHPHVTKLDEEEATEMNFPALTICNMNSFRLSAITTDDFYYVGEHIFDIFNSDFSLKESKYRDNTTWPYVKEKIRPILQQRNDYTPTAREFSMFEFYNRTGQKVEGMVKMCKYRGANCTSMNDWTAVYTRYGKCYTFNAGVKQPPLKTLKGGVDNGLELLLDTQQNEYMPVWQETDEISIEAGFKVQIHVQSEPPFIHELGFGISPGFQTLVSTQEQRITFLPKPWGKCRNGFDKQQHYHFPNYSISACRITCETKFVYRNCECRMIHMPGKVRFCSPEEYKICADKALDYLVKQDDQICVCDTPCEVIRYNLEMSTLRLPSTQASSYLAYKYRVSEDYVRNNFAKLNIFFEALNYETIEQKVAYEIPGLFGDIGGQMGLFIGASILTILELFDYVYEVVKERTWGRKLRKNTSSISNVDGPNNTNAVSETGGYRDINNGFNMSGMDPACPEYTASYFNNSREDEKPSSISTCGQLTPLQEFHTTSCSNDPSSRPGYRTQPGDFRSLPPPPAQYLGNSLMTLRENKGDGGGFEPTQNNLTRRLAPRGGREASMSYNDIYRAPETGWPNGGGLDASNAPTVTINSNRIGNSTRDAHPPFYNKPMSSTGSRPSSFYTPNGDKHSLPTNGSPSRALSDLREYPASIETDIH